MIKSPSSTSATPPPPLLYMLCVYTCDQQNQRLVPQRHLQQQKDKNKTNLIIVCRKISTCFLSLFLFNFFNTLQWLVPFDSRRPVHRHPPLALSHSRLDFFFGIFSRFLFLLFAFYIWCPFVSKMLAFYIDERQKESVCLAIVTHHLLILFYLFISQGKGIFIFYTATSRHPKESEQRARRPLTNFLPKQQTSYISRARMRTTTVDVDNREYVVIDALLFSQQQNCNNYYIIIVHSIIVALKFDNNSSLLHNQLERFLLCCIDDET